MEYAIFGALIVAFIMAVIIKDILNDRKKRREFEQKLRKEFGTFSKKELKPERFVRVNKYFLKHPEEGQIDDVTWNDLGMDEIFAVLNRTYSASGEEYLYHALRSVGKDEEFLAQTEGLIRFFLENEEERVHVQLIMAKLGYMGKYSLYDYLDNLDYLGERSSKKDWIFNGLLLASFCIMPFAFSYGLIAAVCITVYNVMAYFRKKNEIEPYIISFAYVLKLLNAAEKMEKLPGLKKNALFQKNLQSLEECRKRMRELEKGAFWVTAGNGSLGGNPVDLLVDYAKMTLHVDLIQFNKMLKVLRENASAVDEINTILGRFETTIAIASFRKELENANGYCVPKLWEGKNVRLFMEEGYHPLLKTPVKNTLRADGGILLTGSNASGKSTFLKTVAINAVLAQTIHTCTAKTYEAPYFRIYSSMSLRDDLESGDSYYIVEIKALKRILNAAKEAGRPVLCFVDEVLRGTNTVERIAASTQVLKSLHGGNVLCCAATHDVELTHLLENIYDNYHFEEEIADGDILFQYKLLKGRATTRNAISLLEIIGYDEEIVSSARDMAERFVKEGTWSL